MAKQTRKGLIFNTIQILLTICICSCNSSKNEKLPIEIDLSTSRSIRSLQLVDEAFSKAMDANILLNALYKVSEDSLLVDNSLEGTYWKGYFYYKCALYHFIKKNKNESKEFIDKGIEILESKKIKNSEFYALISLLNGLKINFSDMVETPLIAGKIAFYAEEAVKLDQNNPRSYLACAMLNYYAPPSFSKGSNYTVEHLTAAISIYEQGKDFSWGGNLSYYYLINFYMLTNKNEQAKELLNHALIKYQNEKLFTGLAKKVF